MNKEPLTDKLIKRFYGIAGPLDEYKRHQAEKIGNIAFIYLSFFILFGNLIAFFLAAVFPKIVAYAYPALLEVFLLGLFLFVIIKGRQAHIAQFDVEELSEKEKTALKHVGWRSGLFFGLSMYLTLPLIEALSEHSSYLSLLLQFRSLFSAIIAGLLFGGSMQVISRLRENTSEKS